MFLKKVKYHELNIFFDINYINREIKKFLTKKERNYLTLSKKTRSNVIDFL